MYGFEDLTLSESSELNVSAASGCFLTIKDMIEEYKLKLIWEKTNC